jgi:hypothetical protein
VRWLLLVGDRCPMVRLLVGSFGVFVGIGSAVLDFRLERLEIDRLKANWFLWV